MADGKKPMQADGQGGIGADIAEQANPPSSGRADMQENEGQSGGGAYPGGKGRKDHDGFHGGQSVQCYFGDGQLGDDELGENDNATSQED